MVQASNFSEEKLRYARRRLWRQQQALDLTGAGIAGVVDCRHCPHRRHSRLGSPLTEFSSGVRSQKSSLGWFRPELLHPLRRPNLGKERIDQARCKIGGEIADYSSAIRADLVKVLPFDPQSRISGLGVDDDE